MSFRLLLLTLILIFLRIDHAFHFHNVMKLQLKRQLDSRLYATETLSEKLGGIVQFISGQSKITESNIESTLKVTCSFYR